MSKKKDEQNKAKKQEQAKQEQAKQEQAKQEQAKQAVPMLRVTAKRDGFRRAGREWHGTTDVPLAELTDDQVAALEAEPMLAVEHVEA